MTMDEIAEKKNKKQVIETEEEIKVRQRETDRAHAKSRFKKILSFVFIPNISSNSSDHSNYCSILFPSVISKLLAILMHYILYSFCLDHNLIISPFQFGFLHNRSTNSALLFLTNSFHDVLRNNKTICPCFLDLKKVPPVPLIHIALLLFA